MYCSPSAESVKEWSPQPSFRYLLKILNSIYEEWRLNQLLKYGYFIHEIAGLELISRQVDLVVSEHLGILERIAVQSHLSYLLASEVKEQRLGWLFL